MLNRLIRWTKDGWEVEPDQRHADIIVHELQLHDARAVSTPGDQKPERMKRIMRNLCRRKWLRNTEISPQGPIIWLLTELT